jgi:hypothetical protein
MTGEITIRKKAKIHRSSYRKSQLSYDKTRSSMQWTYCPYKRASNFHGTSSLELTQLINVNMESVTYWSKRFDFAFANRRPISLLSTDKKCMYTLGAF